MIYVDEKDLVIPGEVLAEDDFYSGRGTFQEGNMVVSKLMGLVSLRNKKISVIPLKSKYIPKKGDVVIGKITEVKFSMWDVDINSPYSGILSASEVFGRDKKELKRVFDVGDALFLRIIDVDDVKKAKLGLKGRGMGKFHGGIIVDISPTKVPRLIGKKGSMINMIKDKTHCKIVVGQNGLVWVKGEDKMQQITKDIIKQIEDQAHTSGLTNRIRDKLCLIIDGKLPEEAEEAEVENNQFFDNSPKDDFDDEDVLAKPTLQNFKDEIGDEDLFVGNSEVEEVSEVEDFSNDNIDSEVDDVPISEMEDTVDEVQNVEDIIEKEDEISNVEVDVISRVEEEVEEKFEEEDELKPETIDEIRNFEPLSVDESKVDRHSRLHFGEISQAKDKNPSILNPETNGKKAPKWRKMI